LIALESLQTRELVYKLIISMQHSSLASIIVLSLDSCPSPVLSIIFLPASAIKPSPTETISVIVEF
jgi:hypothetical protein